MSTLEHERPVGNLDAIYHGAQVITDPRSQDLIDFHALLVKAFAEGEVEPLSVFQKELGDKSDPCVQFICTCLRDEAERLISGAYGSVQTSAAYDSVQRGNGDNILATRFTLTEAYQRGRGISQAADYMLIEQAKAFCRAHGEKLTAMVAECVEDSEGYWNRMMRLDGIPMRRLYAKLADDLLEEIVYRIPPLEWNPDGSAVSDEVIPEHLQVALSGCRDAVPVDRLSEVIKSWWRAWYIRPEGDFNSSASHEHHISIVNQVLNDAVLGPLSKHKTLIPLSRNDRTSPLRDPNIVICDFNLENYIRKRSA